MVSLDCCIDGCGRVMTEVSSVSGPIVRVAPNEIHINDVHFLGSIYPTSNVHKRDKDGFQTRGLDLGLSTAGTIPHDLHRKRREALAPFFSQKRVMSMEPVISAKLLQLCHHLESAQRSSEALNLYDLYYGLARE